jgi:hypothetical protein
MKRSYAAILCFGFLLLLTAIRPSLAYDMNLGGVNLTAYCAGTFGGSFKAVTVGTGAGDWVCQNGADIHDTRPISVQTACVQQYKSYASIVKAKSGAGAGSWTCVVSYTEQGVNLTAYCVKHFGNDFKSLLIGATSGDWVCQSTQNAHDQRPISVADACKEQYSGFVQALAVPPSSWVCLTNPT